MIVCICNRLNDKDIERLCDSCENKHEFAECVREKMSKRSCLSCYAELIQSFENKNEVAE